MKKSQAGLLPIDVTWGLPARSAQCRASWVPGSETPASPESPLCVLCLCTDDSSTKVDMKDSYDADASTL